MTDYQDIITRCRELAPFADDDATSRACAATVRALGEVLTLDEREQLARSFPADVRRALPPGHPTAPFDENHFYWRVAIAEGVPLPIATEHAQVVCRVLGELMPNEERARLVRHLPEIGRLFEPPLPSPVPVHAAPRSAQNDLAEGRPGGSHPLADADPAGLAHRHSVARSSDPHAESRLSTARGLTQEREDHTLATGTPGSHRPLSRTH